MRARHLVGALVVAAVGIVGLQQVVAAWERAAPPAAPALRPPPSALASLGFRLGVIQGVLSVASRASSIPPDTAPVLEVLADGSLAVRRAPRRALSPGERWRDLAVIVPPASLGDWSAAARGAFAEVLAASIAERPLPATRIRLVDGCLTTGELASMLDWVP